MIRTDELGRGLVLLQDTEAFCFGMDAVLLAHYRHPGPGDMAVDLCCGNGIVPVLMAGDLRDMGISAHITGLEIQQKACALARESVRRNGLEDLVTIEEGDVRTASERFGKGTVSFISCNPPYIPAGSGLPCGDGPRDIARREICCALGDVIRESARMLKMRGRLVMVHRPNRLAEIFFELQRHNLEPKALRFVYPTAEKAPTMVLLEAVRGGGTGVRVEPPLIVRNADGSYTREVLDIYGM